MEEKQNRQQKKDRATTLEEIRGFLREHGIDRGRAEGRRGAVDVLYLLLWSRRDDEGFWRRLLDLVSRLQDPRFRADVFLRSEMFAEATAEKLLLDLRAGLRRQTSAERPIWKRIGSRIGAGGLLAFLLLGSASACGDSCGPDARQLGLQGEEAEVYCGLSSVVLDADVPWTVKSNLLDCLPELDSRYRAEMLEKFQSASEDELADLLRTYSASDQCDEYDDDFDFGHDSGH